MRDSSLLCQPALIRTDRLDLAGLGNLSESMNVIMSGLKKKLPEQFRIFCGDHGAGNYQRDENACAMGGNGWEMVCLSVSVQSGPNVTW